MNKGVPGLHESSLSGLYVLWLWQLYNDRYTVIELCRTALPSWKGTLFHLPISTLLLRFLTATTLLAVFIVLSFQNAVKLRSPSMVSQTCFQLFCIVRVEPSLIRFFNLVMMWYQVPQYLSIDPSLVPIFCVYTIVWWINFILFLYDFKTVSHYIPQDGLVYLCRMGRFSNLRSACTCLPSAGIKDQLHDKLILSKLCIDVLLFDSWTFPVLICLCFWTVSFSADDLELWHLCQSLQNKTGKDLTLHSQYRYNWLLLSVDGDTALT